MHCLDRLSKLRPTSFHCPSLVALSTALIIALLVFSAGPASAQTCCQVRGNVDCDPANVVDIADLARLIDYLFISFTPLCCDSAANIDADSLGVIDIADLARLIDNLFISFSPITPCSVPLLGYDKKQIVFNGVDSVYDADAGLPLDTIASRLVSYLRKRPEIDTAAIMDSISVWARFTDKTIICLPNNTFVDDSMPPAPGQPPYVDSIPPANFTVPTRRFPNWQDAQAALRLPAALRAPGYELPTSVQARVMCNVSPTCFPSVNATAMKNMLNNNGYLNVPTTGSVPSLFNVKNDGAFLFIGHGGPGMTTANDSILALWTTTQTSHVLDSTYAGLIQSQELVYMCMPDYDPIKSGCGHPWHYGFTGKFVAQFMSFVPNSFVYITACESDSIASLRNGFKLAGASVFAGWSKTVHVDIADQDHEFMFDRMLGANASVKTPKENPPQRPFDIGPILQDLQNRGLATDSRAPNAQLHVSQLQDNFGLLAPSIEFVTVDEYYDTLLLAGMFGSDPGSNGRVIVGGTELPVAHWEPQLIRAGIPNSGAGSVGPVRVEVDGLTGPTYSVKRKSNEVNLSEWRDSVTYDVQWAGTICDTIKLNLHFRDDIHAFRDSPGKPPLKTIVVFDCVQDAEGHARSAGTYTWDAIPQDTWNYAASADCVIPGLWNHALNGTFFAHGGFNTNTMSVEMHLDASTSDCGTLTITAPNINSVQSIGPAIDARIFEDAKDMIHLTFDKDWNISGKDTTATECCQGEFIGAPTNFPIHLKISKGIVAFPPDSTQGQ